MNNVGFSDVALHRCGSDNFPCSIHKSCLFLQKHDEVILERSVLQPGFSKPTVIEYLLRAKGVVR